MDESLPQYVAEFRQAIGDRSHSEIAFTEALITECLIDAAT